MDYNTSALNDTERFSAPHTNPLKEFFFLVLGFVVIITFTVTLLAYSSSLLAKFIPFSYESKVMALVEDKFWEDSAIVEDSTSQELSPYDSKQAYITTLGQSLALLADLPDDMTVTFHYADEPIINAFATLGGHIVIYQGLIDELSTENALAMVMAHEIAHIKHRHPVRGLSQGLTIQLALSALTGFSESRTLSGVASSSSLMSQLQFSRKFETQADKTAIQILLQKYGHTKGAEELFNSLKDDTLAPEFFSTHPLSEKRIQRIKDSYTSLNQHNAETTPLPNIFNTRLLSTETSKTDTSKTDTPKKSID